MKKNLFFLVFVLASLFTKVWGITIELTASEPDAKIYANGVLIGNGKAKVEVLYDECVTVIVEKAGYISIERTYCRKKNYPYPSDKDFFKLQPDDAFNSSISTNIANTDIEIKTDKVELEAWRTLSQIITNYFDVIEVTDKETGYLRTAWVAQGFASGVIRTRLIVKLGSSTPLVYKVKLVSEYSKNPKTSIRADEAFREWDRVLRKYENIVSEMQSRMMKK